MQRLARERSNQQIALPCREKCACVECGARRRDRRPPVVDGLLRSRLLRCLMDAGAGVVDAIPDDRPAVVAAFGWHVHLVAAARSVLHRP